MTVIICSYTAVKGIEEPLTTITKRWVIIQWMTPLPSQYFDLLIRVLWDSSTESLKNLPEVLAVFADNPEAHIPFYVNCNVGSILSVLLKLDHNMGFEVLVCF